MTAKNYPIDGSFEDVFEDAFEDILEIERRKYAGFDLSLPENVGLKRIVDGLSGYQTFVRYDPQYGNVIFITLRLRGKGNVTYSMPYSLRGDIDAANNLIDRVMGKLHPPEADE